MTGAFAISPPLSPAPGWAHLFLGSAAQPDNPPRCRQHTLVIEQPQTETDAATGWEQVNDESLLLKISNGENMAMEVLYERYARYAYALAYRIVHDCSTAEDIVQDAFLSIWRKAASYQEQYGSVRSWLQAIVHHRAIDCVRAAHRYHQYTSLERAERAERFEMVGNVSEQTHACMPSSTMLARKVEIWEVVWLEERSALLHSILAQLPREQRQVIELGYFGGYTHAEIAAHWHLPLGTVKGRMRLGLQKMKYLLAQHGIENSD
jgi:RNA polymerase sigma-70 factor, ECF subfamily